MKNKSLLELGLVLPLLSMLVFSAVFYYEYGYLNYFGIPPEFIQVEISNKVSLFFFAIIIILVLTGLFQPVYSLFESIKSTKSTLIRIILLVALLLVFYFGVWKAFSPYYHREVYYLFITLFFGLLFSLIRDFRETKNLKFDDWSLIKYLNYVLGNSLGIILIISSLTCIIAYNIGFANARNKSIYVAKDRETVLIRKYDSNLLFGVFDSSNLKLKYILIKSGSIIDTLNVIKFK